MQSKRTSELVQDVDAGWANFQKSEFQFFDENSKLKFLQVPPAGKHTMR